jgi:glycosyltransferase involved in cell wall biosynthesis
LFNPFQYFLLKKIIKEKRPDIIHTQNLNGIGTYIWSICSNLGIPVVHTLRDYSLLKPTTNKFINEIFLGINRRRSKKVRSVTGISNFILNKYKKLKFFPNAKQKVIFNVVHTKSNYNDKMVNSGALTVGYFGRLELYKGIGLFIKVIKEIDEKIIKKVIICGNGTYKKQVLNEVKYDRRIKYYDQVSSEVAQKIMSQTDLVIVPSCWNEPFGRVIIEAYRQGTPVVASRAGGIPEIVINDSFLFDFNKMEELKQLIVNYFELDITQRRILSRKCFSFSNNFKDNSLKIIKVYNTVLRGTRNEKKSVD